ncbi:MAG: PrgI family protein [Candidatus Nealsonbacteria bacterium]|nr:PrgI family protein [Candidatus Nealsonbacteria bacterium]
MRFTVPQFIERESPIVGPLTFRQFVYIGTAGGVSFLLYFSLGKSNFFAFILIAIALLIVGAALAFLKIGGRGLPTIVANFFRFFISPKMYIWKKTEKPIEVIKREVKKEGLAETPLRVAGPSQLKKLSVQVETKTESQNG